MASIIILLRYTGIFLTEIHIFGIPLRSPIASLFVSFRLISLAALFFIGIYFTENLFSLVYQKQNWLTLFIILAGSIVAFFAPAPQVSQRFLHTLLLYTYVFFGSLAVAQKVGYTFPINLFSINQLSYDGRASGFSAEPSFFVWMAAYFFLFGQISNLRMKLLSCLFFAVIIWATESVTGVLILVIYLSTLGLSRFRIGSLFWNFETTFWFLTGLFALSEVFAWWFAGTSLGILTLELFGSWREASTFASFYGADMIGPFSKGLTWASSLQSGFVSLNTGPAVVSWIEQPWSFLAMFSLEFGWLTTLVVLIAAVRIRNLLLADTVRQYQIVAAVLFFFCIFLSPKWCIYLLFLPAITRFQQYRRFQA